MQLKPGILLHERTYKIERVLGQGSFGITYLAEHTSLGKKVAIKEFFMKGFISRNEDGSIAGMTKDGIPYKYAQKFQKEAQNLACLNHPNIVRVTNLFEDKGTCYYVMDYIDGMDLNEYINSYSPSKNTAMEIIKDVADALEYMHEEKHMLHLDMKPGNIMRGKDGHIFLIDFGLSKTYDKYGNLETSTVIGYGTPGYAPPEQADVTKKNEFRPTIDVYALGATFFKLLTYETPPTSSEIINNKDLIPQMMMKKKISQPLIDFVIKAMRPSVSERIQTIREFKKLLADISTQSVSVSRITTTNSNVIAHVKEKELNEETEVIVNKKKINIDNNKENTILINNKTIRNNDTNIKQTVQVNTSNTSKSNGWWSTFKEWTTIIVGGILLIGFILWFLNKLFGGFILLIIDIISRFFEL